MKLIATETGPQFAFATRGNNGLILGGAGKLGDEHRNNVLWIENQIYLEARTDETFLAVTQRLQLATTVTRNLSEQHVISDPIAQCRVIDLRILHVQSLLQQAIQLRIRPNPNALEEWSVLAERAKVDCEDVITKVKALAADLKFLDGTDKYSNELSFILSYFLYTTKLSFHNMQLRVNLQDMDFYPSATENLFFSLAEVNAANADLYQKLEKCSQQKIQLNQPGNSFQIDFHLYFQTQVSAASHEYLIKRPLRDVWVVDDEEYVLGRNPEHCKSCVADLQFLFQIPGMLERKKFPQEEKKSLKEHLQRIDVILIGLQVFNLLPEPVGEELLAAFDRARLSYWLQATRHVLNKKMKQYSDKESANYQKNLLATQKIAIDLLEKYILAKEADKILVELTVLYRLYLERLDSLKRYSFGECITQESVLRFDSIYRRCEQLQDTLEKVVGRRSYYAVYHHNPTGLPPVKMVLVDPDYQNFTKQFAKDFLVRVGKFVNASVLAPSNQQLAGTRQDHSEVVRLKFPEQESATCVREIQNAVQAVINNKKKSLLEKAEAHYFMVLALFRHGRQREFDNVNKKKFHPHRGYENDTQAALTAIAIVQTDHLSDNEKYLLQIYQVELKLIKFYFSNKEGIEDWSDCLSSLIKEYNSLTTTPDKEIADTEEQIKADLKNAEFASRVPQLLRLHVNYLVTELLIPIVTWVFKEQAVHMSSQRISQAQERARQVPEISVHSTDPLVCYFAHALQFQCEETTQSASQFLYALAQFQNGLPHLELEKVRGSEPGKDMDKLESRAFVLMRKYHAWRAEQPKPSIVWLTDESPITQIQERLQSSEYCGCEECDHLFHFKFNSEAKRAEVVKVSMTGRFLQISMPAKGDPALENADQCSCSCLPDSLKML